MGSESGSAPPADAQAPAVSRHSADGGEPTLPVASVARRLGVAPSTLRTWDRRYGLGPSRHTDGRHRRYGPSDIGRLELMQQALLRGCSTAEAARYALDRMPKRDTPPVPVDRSRRQARQAPPPHTSVRVDTPDGAVLLPAEEDQSAGHSRLARRLSTAALAMDSRAVQRILTETIESAGVLTGWEEVVAPVLSALGTHRRGGVVPAGGAEVEHLLGEAVLSALIRSTPPPAEPRNHRPVLLGQVPEERDGLPLYAFAAGLAERGIHAQLFGNPLPPDVLAVAVRRSSPAAVVLWARRPGADPRLFARVSRGRQRGRLFACGPGWDPAALPAKVELLGDLRAAVDRVEYVLLGGSRTE
nr:MerR family transcriptional regulator [Amycolatopsis suaedae]